MIRGPKYGYYPKSSKSFLNVKEHYKEYSERIFATSNINITKEGARHLGKTIDDSSFKEEYPKCNTVVEKSIGNTLTDSRNSNIFLFCIYVWI